MRLIVLAKAQVLVDAIRPDVPVTQVSHQALGEQAPPEEACGKP